MYLFLFLTFFLRDIAYCKYQFIKCVSASSENSENSAILNPSWSLASQADFILAVVSGDCSVHYMSVLF